MVISFIQESLFFFFISEFLIEFGNSEVHESEGVERLVAMESNSADLNVRVTVDSIVNIKIDSALWLFEMLIVWSSISICGSSKRSILVIEDSSAWILIADLLHH
jgi:hypothetical protein